MKKIILVLILVLVPAISYGSTAGDFTVNRQSTYVVPRDVSNILVLDLTLPEPLEGKTLQVKSIKIHNAGTADHRDFSKLMIWENGASAGWDGDEIEAARILTVPFFDTEISGTFRKYSKGDPWQRIFVTLDTTSAVFYLSERSIKPELVVNSVVFFDSIATGPTDVSLLGFERKIIYNVSIPSPPVAPLAGRGEALSTSTIRWHFTDLSNNEFGFKILDSNLKEVARKEEANLSYLDETGLEPNTEYSGRRIVAFNDRGENLGSPLSIFPAVSTLTSPPVETPTVEEIKEEVIEEEVVEEAPAEKPVSEMTIEELKAKITEIQQKLIDLLNQLIQLIQQQITELLAR